MYICTVVDDLRLVNRLLRNRMGERRKTAREGRSVYMYLIYRLSEVEKTLKKRRQNGHEVPLIWVGKGEEGRERESDDFHGKSKSSTILLELVEQPQPRRIHLRLRTEVVASTCLMI